MSIQEVDKKELQKTSDLTELRKLYEKEKPIIDYIKGQLQELGAQSKRSLIRNNPAGDNGSQSQRTAVLERYSRDCEFPEFRIWGISRSQNGGINYYLLNDEEKTGNLEDLI